MSCALKGTAAPGRRCSCSPLMASTSSLCVYSCAEAVCSQFKITNVSLTSIQQGC